MTIKPEKLHKKMLDAGLPVACVRDGIPVADYSRALTPEEEATAAALIAEHEPDDDYAELRRLEYQKIQRDEYWEAITEALETPKRTEKLDALLAKKAAIKALYPKP